MLVAPLALPESVSSPNRTSPRRAGRGGIGVSTRPMASRVVLAWLLGGLGVLALVPAARGDALLGASLPFWLVAAPLLDLAWIGRRALGRALRRLCRRGRGAGGRRQARRLRAARPPRRRVPGAITVPAAGGAAPTDPAGRSRDPRSGARRDRRPGSALPRARPA